MLLVPGLKLYTTVNRILQPYRCTHTVLCLPVSPTNPAAI